MNEYSFIVEFDEISENQINKLWEYLEARNIKFHVLEEDLKNENQKLKKQLNEKIVLEMKLKDELEGKRKEYQDVYKDVRIEIKSYKNQQKEFIEYLENEIMEIRAKWGNALSNISQLDVAMTVRAYEEVLSKYKKIIGGDNNE